ncbi:solute carrier family 2, facilitated glucose transporter member 12-like [Scleropages formosus]|uniref:Solute carrier family 2, facilitated glucose transporter member 12 n=1 Tax=Scleropages formosus TaxID=113540 RepID=A0A0P7UEQ7_SCLFO|nr:solute carrier family 2, facilitated glucose transporter member 12-like [Scleropages formosus]
MLHIDSSSTLLSFSVRRRMDLEDNATIRSQLRSVSEESTLTQPAEKAPPSKAGGALCRPGSSTFLLLASAVAAVSGFMLGYEMGVISGALLQLRDILSLTCQMQEVAVSALLLGALLVSFVGGYLLDQYGRKFAIIVTAGTIVVGTVVLVGFASFTALFLGRSLVGMAVALSGTASCLYIAEIAPHDRRGLLVSLYELMVVIGVLLGFGLSHVFAAVPDGWKYMFAAVIPPAVLQGGAMCFLPVSPRFLLKKRRQEAALAVLEQLRPCGADKELRSIQAVLREESQHSFLDLLSSKDNVRRRLLIGVALVFLQQSTGQPNVVFYASTILQSVGFHSHGAATLASTGLGAVKVAATVPAVLLVDRVGSRNFLCMGAAGMALSLTTLGMVTLQSHANATRICQSPTHTNHTNWLHNISSPVLDVLPVLREPVKVTGSSNWSVTQENWADTRSRETAEKFPGVDPEPKRVSGVLKWLSLVSLLSYVAAFSISLGPKKVGLANILFLYAAMSFVLLVFVIFYIPETKGQTLEQISKELSEK